MFLKHLLKICLIAFFIIPFFNLKSQNQQLFPVQKNGFWGLINEDGKVIEPFNYLSYIKSVESNGTQYKLWDGKKITVMSNNNKFVYPDSVSEFIKLNQGKYAAYKNGKCYLTDSAGNVLLNRKFDYLLTTQSPGFYEFCGDGSNGVVNSEGKVILKFPLIAFISLKNGVFLVKNKTEHILFNSDGKAIVKDTFYKVDVWNLGVTLISGTYKNSGGRILDLDGNELFRYPKSVKIVNLGNGFLKCEAEDKGVKIYDMLRKRFLSFKFNSVEASLLPNSVIYKADKLYYFYFRDDTAQRLGYNRITVFDTFLQLENQNGKIGFFNNQLQELLPFEFTDVMPINDQLFGLSKNSELYAVHSKSSLIAKTSYKYTHFLAGSNFLKAYGKEKTMDLYDVDANGNLSNLMSFNNISSFFINTKTTTGGSFSFLSNTTAISNQQNTNIRWEYTGKKGKNKLQLVRCDKYNNECDTLVPPIYDSLILVTSSYSVILKKIENRVYNSINRTFHTVIKKLNYLVDHVNYEVFDTAFDYIALNELENLNLNQFLGIKLNAKHVLIDRKTLTLSKEYDYISNAEGSFRRAVPKGKWYKTIYDLFLYQGTIINKKYNIMGNWVLLDAMNNNVQVKEIKGSDSLTDIRPMFMDNYIGQKNYGCVFVFNTKGETIIPCNYQSIQTEYLNGNYYYICSINANKLSLLNSNGAKMNNELYDEIVNKGDVCQLRQGAFKYALNSKNELKSLPDNASLIQFNKGVGFLKIGKKIHGVTEELSPNENQSFTSAYPFISDYTIAKYQNKWGVIDRNFNWKLSPKLTGNCGPVFFTSFIVSGNNKNYFMGFNGIPVVSPVGNLTPQKEIANGVFCYLNRNETLLADRNGNEIGRKKGEIKTVAVKNGIVFNLMDKGCFFNSNTQKSQFYKDTFDINDIEQQLYSTVSISKNILDFTDFQKMNYGCQDLFKPVLAKGILTQGKLNCMMYPKGIMLNRYEGPAGWIVANGVRSPIFNNLGCPYKLTRFSGLPFLNVAISGIRSIDTNSLVVSCAGGLTGVVSNFGTWIIPPIYRKVRKLTGGNYAVNHEQVSHLYNINGKKMDIQFTEYLIDSDQLIYWNFGKMGLYNATLNKTVWE